MRRDRLRPILDISLPVVGVMASQNVLNLIDTAMVGVLGPAALAAVGVAGFATFMVNAAVTGLSPGVQAMVARRKGEGNSAEMALPLNGGLLLALAVGLPLTALSLWLAADIMALLNPDPAVRDAGTGYYQARLAGVCAMGMNFAFRGYWGGVAMTRVYLRTILMVHALNVVLNYLLIFGKFGFPELGATGAGVASTIAIYVGTALHFLWAARLARGNGFLHGLPRGGSLGRLVRLALPTMVQQALFAAGLTAMFWIVGQVGTAQVAASSVIVNILLVVLLPAIAFGLAATSLVGQALGRGEPEDAHAWGWDVVKVGVAVTGIAGVAMVALPGLLLAGFIHDPAVVEIGVPALRLGGVTVVADGVGMVLMHALLGAGAARAVLAVATGTQWLIGLPLAWLTGAYLGLGLVAIWGCFAGYRILQAAIFAVLWSRRGWAAIKV
ncbi:MAG: MATE family efflux transporter [Hyphomicrobiales bacterium]|nr:MATE family efflux transporter [Hyphomicrobiales bacterium]